MKIFKILCAILVMLMAILVETASRLPLWGRYENNRIKKYANDNTLEIAVG